MKREAVLEAIASATAPVTSTEIAALIDLPKSTVKVSLHKLVKTGAVVRERVDRPEKKGPRTIYAYRPAPATV